MPLHDILWFLYVLVNVEYKSRIFSLKIWEGKGLNEIGAWGPQNPGGMLVRSHQDQVQKGQQLRQA